MNNDGKPVLKTLKLPLTMAVTSCLLLACSSTPQQSTPSNTATPIATAPTTTQNNWGLPPATPQEETPTANLSDLDAETLSILNDLLQARDMSMVQGDKMEVERYGNLWDRIRRGYRIAQPLGNQRIDAQKAWFSSNQGYLNRLTARASRYLHHTVTEAERRGIPTELALLPIIESSYDPSATSNASAAGLWQFIPSTGRIYGLNQSTTYDGRRDVIESTRAAYDFLTSLYNQFGSWELALAAYNAGPGRISRAIEVNRSQGLPTDYWSLKLPTETMNYVPRFMAVTQVVGNPSHYGITLPAIANHAHFRAVPVNTGVSLNDVAGITNVAVEELQLLNPALVGGVVDLSGPSRVVIPDALPTSVDAKLTALRGYGSQAPTTVNTAYIRPQISAGNPNVESAQVLRQNNTLPTTRASITPENTIIQEPALSAEERDFIANQIRQNSGGIEPVNVKDGNIQLRAVQTGQSVLEAQKKTKSLTFDKPLNAQTGTQTSVVNTAPVTNIGNQSLPIIQNPNIQNPNEPIIQNPNLPIIQNPNVVSTTPTNVFNPTQATTHQIQRGDTLIGIAQRYGVSVSDLRAWNQMAPGDYLVEGRTLKLYNSSPSQSVPTTPVIAPIATPTPKPLPVQPVVVNEPKRQVPAPTPTPAPAKRADSHTVRAGDTLIGVAGMYGLSVSQLASYNNLDTNARLVRGDKLWLVAGKVQPKPTPTPAPKKTIKTVPYKVQRGETLIGLANRLGIAPSEIAELNDFGANDNLVAGATINLPANAVPAPTPTPAPKKQVKTITYKVQRGETLIGLAERLGVTKSEIAELNDFGANDNLVAGATINLPATVANKLNPPTPTPRGKDSRYTVGAGDTLIGLADRFGVDVEVLANANNMTTKARLVAGETLIVPSDKTRQTSAQNSTQSTIKHTENHKVQSGESLTSLAGRYGVSVSELAGLNNLDSRARLNAGQTIKVPKTTTTHTVRSGESLISLAKHYGIATAELAKMNNLSPNDRINIGQKLTVPLR